MPKKEIKGVVVIPSKFSYSDELIVGYASTPLVDLGDENYRDQIPADLWLKALQAFFSTGAEISFMHRNIIAGKTVKIELDESGPLLYTRPLKKYVPMMIQEGDLTGYSIEYSLNDWELKDNPDPFDNRPIRVFKDFDVWRVSYVDQPMNPGSTFIGGKGVDFSNFHYTFDMEKGEVTVVANSPESFAQLSQMFSDGLGFTNEEYPSVKEISIKMEGGEPARNKEPHRTANPFQKAMDALARLGGQTQEDTVKDTELKAQVTAITDKVTEAMNKFAELELTAEQVTELKEKVEALSALIPQPEEGEKSVAERIADLEASDTADTLATEVTELKSTVEAIVTLLESEKGKSTIVQPIPDNEADPWGSW